MSQDLINGLQAQLDACKQMHNETLNNNLIFRANMILLQTELKTLADKIREKDKEIEELNQKLLVDKKGE